MHIDKEKKVKVEQMFNQIAWKYDFLNHFLSFGIDHLWRKKVVKLIKNEIHHSEKILSEIKILDLATGTGDLAIALNKLKPKQITGIDISEKMLEIGNAKIQKKKIKNISLIKADAENLPFDNNSFDVATVAFGIRNYENLEAGLNETFRVLTNNGIFVILEFSLPNNKFIKHIYKLYFNKILPRIGNKFSKNNFAYSYLPESVNNFPLKKDLFDYFKKAGFKEIRHHQLTGGIVSIYILLV